MNILIIEDDKWLSELYRDYLSSKGAEVFCTDDAQAAVHHLDDHDIDCVLLDMMLPRRSGVELLHELQSYPDLREIPKFVLSTVHPKDYSDETVWKRYGVTEYLYKPKISPSEVYSKIQAVVADAAENSN